MSLSKRQITIIGAVLALVLGAAGVWRYALAKPKTAVATATVERGDIEKTVTAVGSLKPRDYVDVGTQVSGQLQKVFVAIGDRVAKGDPIAQIDPTRYESTVRNDRAGLDSLKAQLSQREAELELADQQSKRNQNMLAERAISQDAAEQSTAAAKVAKAAVAALKAQISAAEATLAGDLANLGYTRILAPMDGTVVSQTSLEGQTLNANQSAPIVVQVANLDVMTVWAKVAEADVGRVVPDMDAYFTTLGQPGKRRTGKVRQVQPTPETVNDVVLYNVLIDVDNADHGLLPSMTVQVFFLLGHAEDVPLVPMAALKPLAAEAKPAVATANAAAAGTPETAGEHPRGGGEGHAKRSGQGEGGGRGRQQKYEATVVTAAGQEKREVVVGVTNRTQAEVVSGLAVGEQVVLPTVAKAGGDDAKARQGGGRAMMPRL